MKEKIKKLNPGAWIFLAVLFLIGVGITLLGLLYKESNPANPQDDALFMNMLLTIPGIVILADCFFYLQFDGYRKKGKFLLHNFLLFFFGCFILECIYFQLIYFGVKKPQYKMTIPAAVISMIYALLTFAAGGIYCSIRKKK